MNINEPIAETLTSGVLSLVHAVGIDLPGLGDPVAQRRQAASFRSCAASIRQGCVSVALSQQDQRWSGAAHDVQAQKVGGSFARLIASAELMEQAAEKLDKHADFWEGLIKEICNLVLELYEMIRIGMLFSWAAGLVGTAIYEARLGVILQRLFEACRAAKLATEEFGKSIQGLRLAKGWLFNPIRLAGWYVERAPSMGRYVAEGMIGGDVAKLLSGQDPFTLKTQRAMLEGNVYGIMMGFKMGDLEERAAARFVPIAKFKGWVTGREVEDILAPEHLPKLKLKDFTTRAATHEGEAASGTNLASHPTQQPAQAASHPAPSHSGGGDPAAGGTTVVPPTTAGAGATKAAGAAETKAAAATRDPKAASSGQAGAARTRNPDPGAPPAATGGGATRAAGAGHDPAAGGTGGGAAKQATPHGTRPDPAAGGGKPAVSHPDPQGTGGGNPAAAHPDPQAAGGGKPAGAAGHPDPGTPPAGSGPTTTAGTAGTHPSGGNAGAAASHSGGGNAGAAASHSAGGTGGTAGTAEEKLEHARYLRDQLEIHERNHAEAMRNYQRAHRELGDLTPERTEAILKLKGGSGDLTLSAAEQRVTAAQRDLDAKQALTKQAEADAKAAPQHESAAKDAALRRAQAEEQRAEAELRRAEDIRDAARRHEEAVAKQKEVSDWKDRAHTEDQLRKQFREDVNKAFPEASERAERELAQARQELADRTEARRAAERVAHQRHTDHHAAEKELEKVRKRAAEADRRFHDMAARRHQAATESSDAAQAAERKALEANGKRSRADNLAAEAERRRQVAREARERLTNAGHTGEDPRALRAEVRRAEQEAAAAEARADRAAREASDARAEHQKAEDAARRAHTRAQRLSEDERHAEAQARALQREVDEAAGKARAAETEAREADEAVTRAREREQDPALADEIRRRSELSRTVHQEAKTRFTHSRSVSSMWHSAADVETKLFAVQSRRETVYNELIRSTFNSAMINLTFDLSANAIHKLGLPTWLMMDIPEKGWKEIALDAAVGGVTFGGREYLRHQVTAGDTSAVGNADRLPGGPLHDAPESGPNKGVDPNSLAARNPQAANARSGRWNPPPSAAVFAPPRARVVWNSFKDYMYGWHRIPVKIPGLGGHSVPLPRLGMFPAAHRNSAQDAPAGVRSGAEMWLGAMNNGGEGLVNGFIKNHIKELLNITPPAGSAPQPSPAQPSPSPSPAPPSHSPAPSHTPAPSPSPSAPSGSPSPSPTSPSPDPSGTPSPQPSLGGGHVTVGPSNPTLWDIAVKVYGDGSKWVDIWHANPQISDPSHIPDGASLKLPVLPNPSAGAHR